MHCGCEGEPSLLELELERGWPRRSLCTAAAVAASVTAVVEVGILVSISKPKFLGPLPVSMVSQSSGAADPGKLNSVAPVRLQIV